MSAITFEALSGELRMNTAQWTGPLDKAQSHLQRFANAASNAGSIISRRLDQLGTVFVGLGAAAAAGIAKTILMASDAEEAASKFGFVFGKAADDTAKALDKFAADAKRSRYELRGMAADIGALLGPMGFTAEETSRMSVEFTKLATDLSSFFNITENEALVALRSGIVGETEPLRRLGVNLSQVKIEAEAMSLGLIKGQRSTAEMMTAQVRLRKASENVAKAVKEFGADSTQAAAAQAEYARAEEAMAKAMKGRKVQMDAATKAMAVHSIIMRETRQAQGDAERTSGSFANTLRGFKGTIKDVAIEFGGPFLKAAVATIDVFDNLLKANRAAILDFSRWVGTVATAENVQAFWSRVLSIIGSVAGAGGRLAVSLKSLWGVVQAGKATLTPMVAGFKAFWDRLPEGVQDVLKVGAALTGMSLGLSTIGSRLPFIGGFATALGTWLNPVSRLGDLFRIVWPFLTGMGPVLALATGPIGLTVAGITALGAGIAAWLRYTETGGKVWKWFVGLVVAGLQWMQGLWARHEAQITRIVHKVGAVLVQAWGLFAAAVQNVWQNVLVPFAKDVAPILEKLFAFFGAAGMASLEAWANAFEKTLSIVLTAFEALLDALSGDTRRFQALMQDMTAAIVDMIADVLSEIPGMGSIVEEMRMNAFIARGEAKRLRDELVAEEKAAEAEAIEAARKAGEAQAQAEAEGKAAVEGQGRKGPMTDEEMMELGLEGSAETGGVLGVGKSLAGSMRGGTSMRGGQDEERNILEQFDPATATRQQMVRAAGFRRGAMNRQMRTAGRDLNLTREQRGEMHSLADDVFSANQRVTQSAAGTQDRIDALAKAEEAFARFNAFMLEAGNQVAEAGGQAAEKIEEGGDAAAETVAEDVAEPLVEGAEEAGEKLVEGADDAAEKMVQVAEKREEDRQDRADRKAQEREDRANAAANARYREVGGGGPSQLDELLAGLAGGVGNAMVQVANAQQTLAKIMNSGDPALIQQTLQAKAQAELQQIAINRRFLERGMGFGGASSLDKQQASLTALNNREQALRTMLAQADGIARRSGVNMPGGGGGSFGDAAPSGMNIEGIDFNMNFNGNFSPADARNAVDMIEAELKRRGQDATGRNPLRRTIRGPINSRVR